MLISHSNEFLYREIIVLLMAGFLFSIKTIDCVSFGYIPSLKLIQITYVPVPRWRWNSRVAKMVFISALIEKPDFNVTLTT